MALPATGSTITMTDIEQYFTLQGEASSFVLGILGTYIGIATGTTISMSGSFGGYEDVSLPVYSLANRYDLTIDGTTYQSAYRRTDDVECAISSWPGYDDGVFLFRFDGTNGHVIRVPSAASLEANGNDEPEHVLTFSQPLGEFQPVLMHEGWANQDWFIYEVNDTIYQRSTADGSLINSFSFSNPSGGRVFHTYRHSCVARLGGNNFEICFVVRADSNSNGNYNERYLRVYNQSGTVVQYTAFPDGLTSQSNESSTLLNTVCEESALNSPIWWLGLYNSTNNRIYRITRTSGTWSAAIKIDGSRTSLLDAPNPNDPEFQDGTHTLRHVCIGRVETSITRTVVTALIGNSSNSYGYLKGWNRTPAEWAAGGRSWSAHDWRTLRISNLENHFTRHAAVFYQDATGTKTPIAVWIPDQTLNSNREDTLLLALNLETGEIIIDFDHSANNIPDPNFIGIVDPSYCPKIIPIFNSVGNFDRGPILHPSYNTRAVYMVAERSNYSNYNETSEFHSEVYQLVLPFDV